MKPTFTEIAAKMLVNASPVHNANLSGLYNGKSIEKRVFANRAGFLAGLMVAREAAIHLATMDVRRSATFDDTLKPKDLLRHRMACNTFFGDVIEFFYPGKGSVMPEWFASGLTTEEAAAQLSYFAIDNLSFAVLGNQSTWEYELGYPILEFLSESVQLFGLQKPDEVKIKRPRELNDPAGCILGGRRMAESMYDSTVIVSPAILRALAKVALDAAKVPVEGVMVHRGQLIRVGASVYIAKQTYKATIEDPIPLKWVVDVR